MTGKKALGVLTKSIEVLPVDSGKVEVEMDDISSGENVHVISFYSRSKKEYTLREISSTGKSVCVITILGHDPSNVALKLLSFLKMNSAELIWASGVCELPKDFIEKYKDKYDLDEKTCSWEGIIGMPRTVDRDMIEKQVRAADEKNTVRAVVIDTVKPREETNG